MKFRNRLVAGFHACWTKAASRAVNDSMPRHVTDLVADALSGLGGKCVLVLGLTYKADVDDTRESPSAEVVEHLQRAGAEVRVNLPPNATRFVGLAKQPKWPRRGQKGAVTTFVFQVRNIPAALYKALGGFATNGVNMTKLESYMVGGRFAATRFYADVEAHPDERPLKLALEELEFFSREVRILGVYPAHPLRIAASAREA